MSSAWAHLGGTKVSRICLGMMSYGNNNATGIARHTWTNPDFEHARDIVEKAIEKGVNFFDTANVYSSGDSERITGECLRSLNIPRSQYVVATKVGLPMGEGPNERGLSRKHIIESVNESLKRLEMDYVDLLIIHRLDRETPPEEIMRALHDVVQSGKALYIGASSMYAWEFAKLQNVAERNGWTKFVSMQNYYNLVYREEEREMIPMLQDQNVLCTPSSPLARGVLARSFDEISSTKRSEEDIHHVAVKHKVELADVLDVDVLKTVGDIANELGTSRAAISLAWLIHKGCVPILGVTSTQQLESSLEALNIRLSDDQIERLEAGYKPKTYGIGITR